MEAAVATSEEKWAYLDVLGLVRRRKGRIALGLVAGRARGDCARILEAIIASYQEFLKETYRNRSAETLELIRRAKDEVQKDLDAKQAAYRAFRHNNPLFAKGKDGKSLPEDRLLGID